MRFISHSLSLFIFFAVVCVQAQDGLEGGADREWAKRTSRINVLDTKMKDLKKKIIGYIAIKKSGAPALDEKGKPLDILSAIVATQKELKETHATYAKEQNELRFRFPEKGELIQRKYIPLRPQTLEQIENEMGLDGELTRVKKKIDKKYSIFTGDDLIKPDTKPDPEEATLKSARPRGDEPARLKLSK